MAANALQVFVLQDGQLLTSEVFGEGVYSIGSEEGSDLHLPSAEIAAKHAVLQFRGGQVTVRDLGSQLGTFVNGQHVAEAPVSSADDINCGPYLLKVRQLARKSAAPAPRPTGLASPVQPAAGTSSNVFPIAPTARVAPSSMPTPRPGSMMALAHSAPQANVIPLHPQPERTRPDIDVDELLGELDHTLGTEEPVAAPQIVAPPPAPVAPKVPSAPPPAAQRAPAPVAPKAPAPPLAAQRAPPVPPAPAPVAPPPAAAVVVEEPSGELSELDFIEGELTPGSAQLPVAIPVAPPAPSPPAPPASQSRPPSPSSASVQVSGPPTQPPRPAASAPTTFEPLQPRERLRVAVSWGHHPVLIRSFAPGEKVVAGAHETAAIPLYGFHLVGDKALAASSKEGWKVTVPPGAMAIVLDQAGRSQQLPATPGGIRLALNRPVRLSIGNLQVELTRHIPPPPPKPTLQSWDWAFLTLLVLLAVPAGVFVHFAPDPPKVRPPPDPEVVKQYVQDMFERKPPPRHVEPRREVQRAPAPKPLAEAKTLQAATDALKPVDQVTKATKEIDNVVNALNKISPLKTGAGAKDALAGLGALPVIAMNGKLAGGTGGGISDLNALGGPVIPGASSLNGAGKLGSGTAGTGHVRGVPISVPKRPQNVQGQIDRDALARVINEHVNDMRNCYERALLRDPNIGAGKVTLEWTIGALGSVTEVSTKTSTLKSSEVVSCLLDVIRRLEFPKPAGGVVIVSYPILFNSVGY